MARANAAERARRLLALMPRLRSGSRLSLTRTAASLGVTSEDLADDLVTLSMCGVPPYTPYELVSVWVEGNEIVSWADPPALSGPVRLSPAEIQALVAALETAGRDRDDPLLAKLLDSAGPAEGTEETLRTRILSRTGEVLGVVAGAVDGAWALRITYLTGASGVISERVVLPYSVVDHAGAWYLTAWCRSAQEVRVFRVDRIAAAEPTGETFEAPEPVPAFDPDPFGSGDLPIAVLRFEPDEDADPRDWPGAHFERHEDGTTVAHVPFASEGWLARRVTARLGGVSVVGPSSMQEVVSRMANMLFETVD